MVSFMGNSYSIAVGAALHGIVTAYIYSLTALPVSEFVYFYAYMAYFGFLMVSMIIIALFWCSGTFTPQSGKEYAVSKHLAKEKALKRVQRKALQSLRATQPKLYLKLNKLGAFTPHTGNENPIPPLTPIQVAHQVMVFLFSFTWVLYYLGPPEIKQNFPTFQWYARLKVKIHDLFVDSYIAFAEYRRFNPPVFGEGPTWLEMQETMIRAPIAFRHLTPSYIFPTLSHQDVGMTMERMILFATSIFECKTYTHFIGSVGLFVHSFYRGSVVLAIHNFIEQIGFPEVEPQVGLEDFTNAFALIKTNWKKFVSTSLFSKISLLITTLISLGMCSTTAIEWKVAGVPVFGKLAATKHVSALSLGGVIVDTIELFMQTALQCFSQKSLRPLLYDSVSAYSFESQYLWLTEKFSDMKIGDWDAVGATPEEYYTKLSNFMEECSSLQQACRDKIEKTHILRKQERCIEWKNEYMRVVNSGALRESPFTMCFYGTSSVGKTTLANLCNIVALNSNGHASDPSKIVTWNENDKFFSNYTVDKTSIIMDDMCNTVLEHIQESPLANIIKFCNNNPEYAVMASLEDKGKIAIRPKTVIITTNVSDLQAMVLSNEPASILRRLNLRFDVSVKMAYRQPGKPFMDSHAVLAYKATLSAKEALYPDIWDIRMMDLQILPCGACQSIYVDRFGTPVDHDSPTAIFSLREILNIVIDRSRAHYALQKEIVRSANCLSREVIMCPDCGCCDVFCECIKQGPVKDVLVEGPTDASIDQYSVSDQSDSLEPHLGLDGVRETYTYIRDRLTLLYAYEHFEYIYWLPGSIYYARWFRILTFILHWDIWKSALINSIITIPLAFAFFYYICEDPIIASLSGCVWWSYQVYRTARVLEDEYRALYERLDNLRGSTVFSFKIIGTASVTAFCSYFTVCHLIRPFIAAYRMREHSALNPLTEEELVERTATVNCWASNDISKLPGSQVSNTTTPLRAMDKVSKNLVYVRYKLPTGNQCTDGVFISTNCLLIPNHIFKQQDITVDIVRKHESLAANTFVSRISKSTSYHIPDTDFSLTYVANGGDWSDISEYLPTAQVRRVPVLCRYRNRDGSFLDSVAMYNPQRTNNGVCSFEGGTYDLSVSTFEGMCMAILLTDSVSAIIAGFHLGGRTGASTGCAGLFTLRQYENARKMLLRNPGILLGSASGILAEKKYDKQFFEGEDIHPKCPTNFLPHSRDLKVYGGVIGKAKYYSKVVETPISALVEKYCGIPREHGPPRFKDDPWKPWYTALAGFSDPSLGPFPSELRWATLDYVLPLLKVVEHHHLWQSLKPLTKLETLCGIDGTRFIDQMGKTKSIGFPLGGKMSSYMTPVDSTPQQTSAWELDELFWTEVERLEQNALKGVRSYPIFSASLKDEPTKLTKDKIRVFTGAAIEQKLIIRKYFLPLTRIICHHSILSECAVGINAVGPEWDELHQHITQYGTDRIVAGDFSAYDQRMAASITNATFWIFIELAKRCDYSADDIKIMENLVQDIISPMVAYNGTLLQFMGGNPSGQNLTVFTNSIANSLLYRVAYARKAGNNPEPFRQNVAAMFYGDDSIGGVRRDYDKFNNCIMFEAMEDIGMKFTPPDKSSSHTPFMLDQTVDFLKRKSLYQPELGVTLGSLEPASIFKSLHSVMESSHLSLLEQCAINIDGALREFTYHGREEYELRQSQLAAVARGAGITHMCSLLDVSYADRVIGWKENYITQSGEALITG